MTLVQQHNIATAAFRQTGLAHRTAQAISPRITCVIPFAVYTSWMMQFPHDNACFSQG